MWSANYECLVRILGYKRIVLEHVIVAANQHYYKRISQITLYWPIYVLINRELSYYTQIKSQKQTLTVWLFDGEKKINNASNAHPHLPWHKILPFLYIIDHRNRSVISVIKTLFGQGQDHHYNSWILPFNVLNLIKSQSHSFDFDSISINIQAAP